MITRTSHSYFVAMVDYGQRGLEAVVRPEWTRRDIVEMLRSGELKDVAFIHHVDGLFIEDVTADLRAEALPNWHPEWRDPHAAADHARKLRAEA